ncbi:MAG: ATP-binding protein [Deltaproteobacteria bacterium]|nr:ATP-binding protein [Deltaproteobacteria bacterium]
MFTRLLPKPKSSVLLLGPRGTGKSTWIQQNFSEAPLYDLLNTGESLRLSREPQQLFQELETLKPGTWVVIDEVQKVPALLDEVHRLIEKKSLKFVLCGSSARKLKRGAANLLAGRALSLSMFPLVSAEVNEPITFDRACRYGMLPTAYTSSDPESYLRTYAETYLQEEIKSEALTRNIGSFGRFLEIAARQNGQVTNASNISRDAMVVRQTVQGFFDILCDTLIGFWLPAWKLKRATKQVAHPKFYFFDAGVARSLSGRLPYPPTAEELGPLFETFLMNEVRAYLSYSNLHYPLFFWSSHDQVEVDLFCETRKGYVAIEIKSAKRWDSQYNKGLYRIAEEMGAKKVRCVGVHPGERNARVEGIEILTLTNFLKALWNGEIIA